MTKTIQAALSPLLIIGAFCGLSVFEYPLGRPWPRLTCLYFLITLSLYVYLYYYLIYINSSIDAYINWQGGIITFSTIISMLANLFHFKELNMCLRKLSIVDDTLKTLGTPKEYRWLYNLVIRLMIGWIVLVCFMIASDTVALNCNCFTNCILVPLMGNYMLCVNTFNGIIWGTILRCIGYKFQQINKYIHNMLEEKKGHVKKLQKLIFIQQRTEAKECKQLIWIIMHVHLELCHISRIWNKVFSIQMTLQMASYFALLVQTFVEFYTLYIMKHKRAHTMFKQVLNILYIYFWAIVCNANLLTFNYTCQSVCDETKETAAFLHKLSNDSFDKNLREQILQFILQIKQTARKFSGMGILYFGFNFIRWFYTSAATTAVFILQMRFL